MADHFLSSDFPVQLRPSALIKRVQDILCRQIYYFDKEIGDAVKELCPDPSMLDDEQARNLIDAHRFVFQRAYCGSTLAVALLDNERNHLWIAGLGDYTVGALLHL